VSVQFIEFGRWVSAGMVSELALFLLAFVALKVFCFFLQRKLICGSEYIKKLTTQTKCRGLFILLFSWNIVCYGVWLISIQ